MVKGNRVIPNAHFHKDWQRRIRTWFDQPAQKAIRRERRVAKAQKLAPRPADALRPAVRCPTIKYNRKVRAGRGYTIAELKAAGVNPLEARGIGISVDKRRHNRSQEGFNANVQRLKNYKAKLIVFPKKSAAQGAGQLAASSIFPITNTVVVAEPRVITKAERENNAHAQGRKAFMDKKKAGKRARVAREKAAEAAKGAKKGGDDD